MPLNGVQQPAKPTPLAPGAPPPPPPISATFTDDSLALDPFYAALWQLERSAQTPSAAAPVQPAPASAPPDLASAAAPVSASLPPDVVTILHYGDSPTTADLITGDARELLQARFGDAGQGFNLAAKPWAWYGHRGVEIDASGWKDAPGEATGVGKMKGGSYGLGGGIFVGGVGAKSTFKLTGTPPTAADVQFLASPDGGSFTVSAGGTVLATVNTRAERGAAQQTVPLPAGTKQVVVEVTDGTVSLFGVDFKHGTRGVLYDSLGLNGATTTVLSRTFDPLLWSEELHHTQPALIVINYGTNESQFGGLVKTLDGELRTAIDRARAADPGVPILVMSPMDRGQRGGLSDIHTMPEIPEIVAIQQKAAADEHAAFFNTYAAMGGDGTMARWYAGKPRLVAADFIHPTPQGARLVAGLLIDNLYAGYDRWKLLHGIAVAPKPAAEPAAPAASGSNAATAATPKTLEKPMPEKPMLPRKPAAAVPDRKLPPTPFPPSQP